MVDMFVTCSLHSETAGGADVVLIAKETQTHHHTRSCKKKITLCRWKMPKFPSDETLICKPVPEHQKDELPNAEKALEKVLAVINDKELMELVWESCPEKGDSREDYILNRKKRIMKLCELADVSFNDYKRYLKMSRCGYSVVLQRDTDEIWINGFNPNWLRAWNGNIDVSPVFGFFAVAVYVTDYNYKNEPEDSIIREALKSCTDEDMKTKMKIIANVFLTAKQMGEPLAIYKLIPNLTMTNSNVTCQYVSLEREEGKMKRMRRATEQDKKQQKDIINIEDVDGDWCEQIDFRDKYLRRPAELHHCSLSQFARMYKTSQNNTPDDLENEGEGDEPGDERPQKKSNKPANCFTSFNTVFGCDGVCCEERKPSKLSRLKKSPKIIELPPNIQIEKPSSGEAKNMSKQKIPAALRYHKEKKDKSPNKFFLQELLLYVPFGKPGNTHLGTQKLLSLPDSDIEALYLQHQDHIKQVKSQVMPWLEDVEEERFFVDAAQKNQQLTLDQIGEDFAPGKEQDNLDAENEGLGENPDFNHLDPALIEEHLSKDTGTSKVTNYGKIIIPNKAELCLQTRQLDNDQRRVVDIFVTYCKDLVKARKTQQKPPPPHLKVHGAAGTGKSTVIDLSAKWGQLILLRSGDSPDQPYIIKTAFTGTAAANIEGQTLSTTFGFVFGNSHTSLSDKKRDQTKIALQNLEVVIADEDSMIKSDMFYQLDLKLQEIKERRGVPFGGVLILLFGDIFQLKPVAGSYIFSLPSNRQYHNTFYLANRWEMLTVINLETNHRQGADGAFADLLNRIRFARPGELSHDDNETLKSRVRSPKHDDIKNASLHVVCTKRKAFKLNADYIKTLPGEETLIKAVHFKKTQKSFKPIVNQKDGTVSNTGFMDELRLKLNAKVMLIRNIDTCDSLTNGQTGTLMAIEKDSSGYVKHLVVLFDRPAAGKQLRAKNPQLAKTHPGGTMIETYSWQYSLGKTGTGSTATLIQFPIILAHAITAHKTQGMTVYKPKTCSLDVTSAFEAAQAYVMLGRPQSLEQLFIPGQLDTNNIYASSKALEEYKKMNKRSINNQKTGWYPIQENIIRITSLNVARLSPHMQDVQADPTLLKADIIHLCETWLKPAEAKEYYNIPGFTSHFICVGEGKGLTTYTNKKFQHYSDISKESHQITLFRSMNLDSIHVYRSSNTSLEELKEDLKTMIQPHTNTIISGDFNLCLKKDPNNMVSTYLYNQGFNQLNSHPTHIQGGQIDHVYFIDRTKTFNKPDVLRYSPYYSDHDALCVSLCLN